VQNSTLSDGAVQGRDSGCCACSNVPLTAPAQGVTSLHYPTSSGADRAKCRLSGVRRARRPRSRKPERPARRLPGTQQGGACEAVSGEPERSDGAAERPEAGRRQVPAFPMLHYPATSGAVRSEAARSGRHGRAWTRAESGKPPRAVTGIRRGTSRISVTAKQAASFSGFRGGERPSPCRERRAAERRTAERSGAGRRWDAAFLLLNYPAPSGADRAECRLSGVRRALPSTSIGATPHWGDRLFRLTSEPMRFPPLAVIGSSPRVHGSRSVLRGGFRERNRAARARANLCRPPVAEIATEVRSTETEQRRP
jgi:hypothetical protein